MRQKRKRTILAALLFALLIARTAPCAASCVKVKALQKRSFVGTDEPAMEGPSSNAPGTDESATEGSSSNAPSTEEPMTGEQSSEEPVTEGSFSDVPSTDEPVTEGADAVFSGGSFGGGYGASGGGGYISSGGSETEKVHRQPKLMVTQNPLSGVRLAAGQTRDFTFCLQNMNAEESVYNLMVSVGVSQELSCSTTALYFGNVYPQETVAIPLTLCAAANAAAGRGSVTLSFSYENEQGTAYSDAEELFLEIDQPLQAVMEGFSIASQVYAQETVESAVSVRNVGKATVYNATVELQAEGLTAAGTMFAGNLEAGASYEGTLRIYVGAKNSANADRTDAEDAADMSAKSESAYGPVAGTLTLTYEDAYGKVCRQTQEFSTYILEPQIMQLTVQEEEPARTNQWWAAIFILTFLLCLLSVCFLAWRLKKSRNALADLLAAKEEKRA